MQGETEAIGKLLEKTMLKKYGPAELSQRFMVMDTICDATQARAGRRTVQPCSRTAKAFGSSCFMSWRWASA